MARSAQKQDVSMRISLEESKLKLEIEQKHMWLDAQCEVPNWQQKGICNICRIQTEINYHIFGSKGNLADFASTNLRTEELQNNDIWTKSKRSAMTRNRCNQNQSPALKTKVGNY